MRELTTFSDRKQAELLAGYLVTQSIPAQVESESGQWVLWVVNDDDRDAAQKFLEQFRENPNDQAWQAAQSEARQLARQEVESRKQARRRQISLNKRWSGHWWYAHPATTILIGLSVLVAVLCTDWSNLESGWMGLPALCTKDNSPLLKRLYITSFEVDGNWIRYPGNPFTAVWSGEFWRPLTPIFIHFSVLHILFNMMWMKQLAAAVEFVKGTRRFLVLVFLMAVTSNLAQFYWSGPTFGGMSGVVFGMIGYVWMQGKTQPQEGLGLRPETVVYCLLWLFLCMGGAVGPIANAAHLVGFGAGILLGARRYLWKRMVASLRSP